MKFHNILILVVLLVATDISSQPVQPVAYWNFDMDEEGMAKDMVSNIADELVGFANYKEGVTGKSLKFDTKSTYIIREGNAYPDLKTGQFTFEAWIAQQAYPLNWCPVFQQKDADNGFFFGVDSDGRFGLHVSVEGKWYKCNSHAAFEGYETFHTWNSDGREWELHGKEENPPEPLIGKGNPALELLKWNHIAGVFDASSGIRIYLNGKLENELDISGEFEPSNQPFFIGRNPDKVYPAHTERFHGTQPLVYSFDGLMDELKIYNVAMTADQIAGHYHSSKPENEQPLEFRKIPTGPEGPGRFGAYYTLLKYDEDFDRYFRMKENPDVVVMFDKYPFKLVCWHGLNYYPIWYAENDIGISHEAVETWGHLGTHEAMMDKQVRYANVRILESNDARVVLHYRHAMNNMEYGLIHQDSVSGWHDWCDEILTIYPDGIAARNLIHWCSYLGLTGEKGRIYVEDFIEEVDDSGKLINKYDEEIEDLEDEEDEEEEAGSVQPGYLPQPHSYEQDNFIVPIGLHPSDILHKEGGIHANMNGEESNYTWEFSGRPRGKKVKDPNIVVYNIKAESKPFMIVPPEAAIHFFEGNGKPWPNCYYWWDHWPVAQIKSDGKQLHLVNGRPSSSCIGSTAFKLDTTVFRYENKAISVYSLLGMGMNIRAGELVPLAKSWVHPPLLKVNSEDYIYEGYSREERCYKLDCREGLNLVIEMAASPGSPLINPAFIIENWGEREVELKINGAPVNRGDQFRYSLETDLSGKTKLVSWIEYHSEETTLIEFTK